MWSFVSHSREARPTIRFVDEYCQLYAGLFPEVRSFEAFKFLHLGLISQIKRKSLPAIAKAVGLNNQQNLHHFFSESPWSAKQQQAKDALGWAWLTDKSPEHPQHHQEINFLAHRQSHLKTTGQELQKNPSPSPSPHRGGETLQSLLPL
ncbi:MAG: hypothetical protein OHK0047_32970 [Leptolyngbyaceae cyanobacterium]